MILYFSGCGNSRFIAQNLANTLNERLIFIPDAQPDLELSDDESLGFVFPIYSWRPPKVVMEFIEKLHLNRKPAYVWMAATCGDNGGVADNTLAQLLQEKGWPLQAAYCFVMPNTYVNMAGMGIDKPELAQRKIEEAKKNLPSVIQSIRERKPVQEMRRGIFPKFKTNVIGKNFYRWVSDEPFYSTDDCISCGKCVQVCPFHNITLEDGRPKWHGNCTTCDACYHYCPKHAIQYGKASKGKGQYHFPE